MSEILICSLSENDRQEIFKGAYVNEQREFTGVSNSRFSKVVFNSAGFLYVTALPSFRNTKGKFITESILRCSKYIS